MSKDLVVLVADVQQEKTLETLLRERQKSFGIRPIHFDIFRHPGKDPGVYRDAARFLRPYVMQYDYALVFLDQSWNGSPGSATVIAQHIGEKLYKTGWDEHNCKIIVIEPELEVWVWADSPVVPDVLRTTWNEIRTLARQQHYWNEGDTKPHKPKELLEAILFQQLRPRSAAIFQALANRISLNRCNDPSFILLRKTLAEWFTEIS